MALIKCPECGNDVSTHSTVCPKCGEPIQKEVPTEEQRLKRKKRLKKSMNSCLIDIGIFSGIITVELLLGKTSHEKLMYALISAIILVSIDLIKFVVLQKKYEKD